MTVDRGSSWRPAGRGLPAVVPGWAPLALAGDPTRSGAIYAATGKGLYATTNSGRSWKRSLACATLWASANAGAEWKSVGAALPPVRKSCA